MDEAAREVFTVAKLLHWQRVSIANTLAGKRQIVILPTGYGKSLCFLVPAVMLPGVTLIIYPLLALMKDQKRRMDASALHAVVLKGGQTKKERDDAFLRISQGKARVIIANPEILLVPAVLHRLGACNISHIAIDEAHCVSEWGESFRPAYTKLGDIIARLGVQRVTALTATASPPVLERIQTLLFETSACVSTHNSPHMRRIHSSPRAEIVRGNLDRPNIHYRVRYAAAKRPALLSEVLKAEKPCVVFCSTRKLSEEHARMLSAYFQAQAPEDQCPVRFYHAGMTKPEKKAIEDWFFASKNGVLCCTSAYGMGVDKSDIRTCIHAESPSKIEFFIQEAGRAGRDKKAAHSVLLWSSVDKRHFPALAGYAHTTRCRRQFLLDYLDGEQATCSGCDICEQEAKAQENASSNARTSTKHAQSPLAATKNVRTENATTQETDSAQILQWIQKNRLRYREEDAVFLLQEEMNKSEKNGADHVWELQDIRTVLAALKDEKKIQTRLGKLSTVNARRTKKLLTRLPHRQRHQLHHLRRQIRQLAQGLERLQQIF